MSDVDRKSEPTPPTRFREIDSSRESGKSFDPAIDIGEDQYEYLLVVEVPGIAVEDVRIKGHSGILEISGTTERRAAEQNKRYIRVERKLGDYHRAFELPDDADADRLHYDMLSGVVHIHLPKVRPAGAMEIPTAEMEKGNEKTIPAPDSRLLGDRPNLDRTIPGKTSVDKL